MVRFVREMQLLTHVKLIFKYFLLLRFFLDMVLLFVQECNHARRGLRLDLLKGTGHFISELVACLAQISIMQRHLDSDNSVEANEANFCGTTIF